MRRRGNQKKNQLLESQRLSSQMWDSWQSGNFWIMYAARQNFAFDDIYWKKIDRRFFGSVPNAGENNCDVWRKRLHLLEPAEKELMEKYVSLKVKERNIRRLTWDPDEYTVGWIQRMKEIRWKEMEREEKERVDISAES